MVHDETEDVQHELSELEILEKKLQYIRKKKRSKSDDDVKQFKRKRIKQLSDDSD